MPLHGVRHLQSAINGRVDDLNDSLRAKYLQALSNIAIGTPVDEGRAAGNWFMSENTPSNSTRGGDNIGLNDSLSQLSQMPQWVLGKKLFYANNLPYINRLNYTDFAIVPGTRGWVNREMDQLRVGIRGIR